MIFLVDIGIYQRFLSKKNRRLRGKRTRLTSTFLGKGMNFTECAFIYVSNCLNRNLLSRVCKSVSSVSSGAATKNENTLREGLRLTHDS